MRHERWLNVTIRGLRSKIDCHRIVTNQQAGGPTTMKSQDAKRPKRFSKQSAASLAARAAEAEKRAETARNLARLLKTRSKEARKAYKHAKKVAKQARKEAKAAAKALKAKAQREANKRKMARKSRALARNGSPATQGAARKTKTVRPPQASEPKAASPLPSSGEGAVQP